MSTIKGIAGIVFFAVVVPVIALWQGESHSLNKSDFNIFLLTDSTIVRNRINYTRRRADNNERSRAMAALTDLCKQKLQGFASFQANWNPRRHNVATFGH